MSERILPKTILISLIGHLTFFSLFSLSFGNRLPLSNFSGVYFLPAAFYNLNFYYHNTLNFKEQLSKKQLFTHLDKTREFLLIPDCYFKPQINLCIKQDKDIFMPGGSLAWPVLKGENSVMVYPQLPYHFLLYFKDRQAVHIEVMFKITNEDGKAAPSISIKRKISSGNLEVDLLVIRYLSRYLFIRNEGFPLNTWQTVKIELSPKNK